MIRFALLAGALILAGCSGSQSPQPSKQPTSTPSTQTAPVTIVSIDQAPPSIVQTARQAADRLTGTLKANLRAAMQDGGLPNAISFCAEQASRLTDQVNAEFGASVDLKRTTDRFRNPSNAPDPLEQAALSWATRQQASGTLPREFVQKTSRDGHVVYRFYRVITIGTACLACHGDRQHMNPAVRDIILKTYPNDQATGYRKGDFRGLVRIEILETPPDSK